MTYRVLELSQGETYLAKERGFLILRRGQHALAEIPFGDLAAIIAVHPRTIASQAVLLELAERHIPYIVCGPSFMPTALLWPVASHHQQASRFELQIDSSKPSAKRAWQQLIRDKILRQAAVLFARNEKPQHLEVLAKRVRSGDPDNLEAQAARYYWPRLLGAEFTRNPEIPGPNSLLNYGYAVLRAATARAIMGAGLHPTIGIHHCSGSNPMALADDFMEPFRPVIDWKVYQLVRSGQLELDKETKRTLASLLLQEFNFEGEFSPMSRALERLAFSWVAMMQGDRTSLALPKVEVPTEHSETGRAEMNNPEETAG